MHVIGCRRACLACLNQRFGAGKTSVVSHRSTASHFFNRSTASHIGGAQSVASHIGGRSTASHFGGPPNFGTLKATLTLGDVIGERVLLANLGTEKIQGATGAAAGGVLVLAPWI